MTARIALGIVLGLLATVVVFVVWALPARELPPTGPAEVATQSWILESGRRDPLAEGGVPRRFPVQAWYPSDGPDGPVVVFVHGSMGRREGYLTLLRELASRGFVVVAADHPPVALQPNFPDASSPPPSPRWDDFVGQIEGIEDFLHEPVFHEAVAMVQADVVEILDDLPDRLGVSTDRVALTGHSFGGGVALYLCETEPRCAAIVDLDGPPLLGDRLPAVVAPLLLVTAGQVCATPALAASCTRQDAVAGSATGPVLHAELPDAGHLDLSDLPLLARPAVLRPAFGAGQIGHGDVDAQLRAVSALTVAFLDRHLRGSEGDPDAVVRRSDVLRARSRRSSESPDQ